VSDGAGISVEIIVGTVVAGIIGYFAIAILIRVLTSVGMGPFGVYCIVLGVVGLALL
jgi:undecaprenyl pyrophosphate phosphatase UppP